MFNRLRSVLVLKSATKLGGSHLWWNFCDFHAIWPKAFCFSALAKKKRKICFLYLIQSVFATFMTCQKSQALPKLSCKKEHLYFIDKMAEEKYFGYFINFPNAFRKGITEKVT